MGRPPHEIPMSDHTGGQIFTVTKLLGVFSRLPTPIVGMIGLGCSLFNNVKVVGKRIIISPASKRPGAKENLLVKTL